MSSHDKLDAPEIVIGLPVTPADADRLLDDMKLENKHVPTVVREQLRNSARRDQVAQEITGLAKKLLQARRLRDQMFTRDVGRILGEPAGDMLLALYCAPNGFRSLTRPKLSRAAGVSDEAGERWQAVLTAHGLIELAVSSADLPGSCVRLTAQGNALMHSFLSELAHSDCLIKSVWE